MLALIMLCAAYPATSNLTGGLFAEWVDMLKPERETMFFRFFVMLAVVIQFLLIRRFLPSLPSKKFITYDPKIRLKQWEWIIPCLTASVILLPGAVSTLAKVTDRFYHIDYFIMTPAWAASNGLGLNTDVMGQYSIMIPMLFGGALKYFGHFDYPSMMFLMMLSGAIYFAAAYLFLRIWLRSIPAALWVLIASLSWQMFHPGVFPVVWQFPSATVLRYMWDLVVLYFILKHVHTLDNRYLLLGSIFSALAMLWMVDTGAYLWMAFASYVAADAFYRQYRNIAIIVPALTLTPFFLAFAVLWALLGHVVWQAGFWQNCFEFAGLFTQGFGAMPITSSLQDGHPFIFALGLAIPVFYTWTLICVGAMCLKRQIHWENIMACVLSVYGLGLYHYYVVRSAPTSYAVVCIPAVFILGFWLQKLIGRALHDLRRWIWIVLIASIFIPMILNPRFQSYFKSSGQEPWDAQLGFAKDVSLITGLTAESSRVALFSSFETKLLIEANRKPFFYCSPMVQSDAMPMLQFRGTFLVTHARMQKTITQLESQMPEYVFVEKKLFFSNIPPVYYERFDTLMIMMAYLHQKYEAGAQGEYLLALKRKGGV